MLYDEIIFDIVGIQFQQGLLWVIGVKHDCDDVTVGDRSDVAIFGPDGELVMSCPAGTQTRSWTAKNGGSLTVELNFQINAKRGEYLGGKRPVLRR